MLWSYLPGLPHDSHVMLLDKKSGDIWEYGAQAMSGKEKPVEYGLVNP